jgi:hypothetical protein
MIGRSRDMCGGESVVMASGVPQMWGRMDWKKKKPRDKFQLGCRGTESGFEPAVSAILIATAIELHVSVWEGRCRHISH